MTDNVLIAFSAFKGTLTSGEANALAAGVVRGRWPSARVMTAPLADGGDGTLTIALDHGFSSRLVPAFDALGRQTSARVGVREDEALVEMAEVCGIAAIADESWDGFDTTSRGLGAACARLLDDGVTRLTISLGGSASTDGGLGLLVGLGAVGRDADGHPCAPTLAGLERTSSIDLTGLHPRAAASAWTFLVDVDSPLTGPTGAARMFGPQKHLDEAGVERAEAALERWGSLVGDLCGHDVAQQPGAGAAGGVLVGAHLIRSPQVLSGAEHLAALTGLDELLADCTLVITGEGALDAQSLRGKGPGLVLERASRAGVRAAVIAGRSSLTAREAGAVDVVTLEHVAGSAEAAMADPDAALERATHLLLDQLGGR